jgi:hypothetical protein
MLYSFVVLLFGIYIGQEFALPSVKITCLKLYAQFQPRPDNEHYIKFNYTERFIKYLLNTHKE